MEQRISLVTLGVDDLSRARGFYEALGWTGAQQPGTTGAFADPDGYVWEVAHNPGGTLAEDSTIQI
jgi:uncharacterized protein